MVLNYFLINHLYLFLQASDKDVSHSKTRANKFTMLLAHANTYLDSITGMAITTHYGFRRLNDNAYYQIRFFRIIYLAFVKTAE